MICTILLEFGLSVNHRSFLIQLLILGRGIIRFQDFFNQKVRHCIGGVHGVKCPAKIVPGKDFPEFLPVPKTFGELGRYFLNF